MAGIGMYGVYYAKAELLNGVVTGYTGGVKQMGKARSATFTPNTAEDNVLYANNGEAERDNSGASGGDLSTELDRLTMEAAADLFGLTLESVQVTPDGAGEPVTGQALKFTGLEQSAPVGVAYVQQQQINNSRDHHMVLLYRRAVYSMPEQAARTMENGTVEWQTPTLSATVSGLEGTGENAWFEMVDFPTLEAALAYVYEYLGEAA